MPGPSLDAPTTGCTSPLGSSSPPACTIVPEAICYRQPQLPAPAEQSFQEVDKAPITPTAHPAPPLAIL